MIKAPISFLRHLAVRFQTDRHGSILPLFGIMLVFIIVVAGASMDVSRAVNAREKLSYALDAAALAAATKLSTSVLSDDEVTEIISDSFKANLATADFLDEAIENMTFTVNSDEGNVTVSTSATMNNLFINLGGYGIDAFGPKAFTFGTEAQVAYSRFDVELAMVVDVTGSMGWAIDDLKDAAQSVVDILIPDGTEDSKVKISLVPYSVGVNMDSYAATATNNYSSRCATERTGDEEYTDASYTVEPLGNGSGTYRGSACSDSVLQPLSDDRSTLTSAINDLETNGYTAGHTGIGIGWYTLSPKWSDLWPSSSAPAAYDDDDVLKFALIMTDGAFNTQYEKKTWTKKQCKKYKYKKKSYGGTCLSGTNDYWVEQTSGGFSGASSKRGMSLCDAMKSSGIEIFTVYFGSSSSSSGARVMQDCADTGNYYMATSSDELIGAFSNIAKKIQQIYLSK